jgi:hypothetical protein
MLAGGALSGVSGVIEDTTPALDELYAWGACFAVLIAQR